MKSTTKTFLLAMALLHRCIINENAFNNAFMPNIIRDDFKTFLHAYYPYHTHHHKGKYNSMSTYIINNVYQIITTIAKKLAIIFIIFMLTESLYIPPRVLDPMLLELLETSTITIPIGPEIYQYNQWYDPRLASDTLKKLLSIVILMGNKLILNCTNCLLTTNIIDKLLLFNYLHI
eukprot:407743_1